MTGQEIAVLALGRALVDDSSPALHRHRLVKKNPPAALSEAGHTFLQGTLVRGITKQWVDGGAWHKDPEGRRGWERPMPPLRFGQPTLSLLAWLHGTSAEKPTRLSLRKPLMGAEALLAARAIQLLADASLPIPKALATSPLAWLLAGQHLAENHPVPNIDWPTVLKTEGPWIEGLQQRLTQTWITWDAVKRESKHRTQHGLAQLNLAHPFLQAVGATGRPSQGTFLIRCMPPVAQLPDAVWDVPREKGAALSAYMDARRAQLALPLLAGPLIEWRTAWSRLGFVDDGYEGAQRLLMHFEDELSHLDHLHHLAQSAESLPDELGTS